MPLSYLKCQRKVFKWFAIYFSPAPKRKAQRGRPRNDSRMKLDTSTSTTDPDYAPIKRGRGRPQKHFPKSENERFVHVF